MDENTRKEPDESKPDESKEKPDKTPRTRRQIIEELTPNAKYEDDSIMLRRLGRALSIGSYKDESTGQVDDKNQEDAQKETPNNSPDFLPQDETVGEDSGEIKLDDESPARPAEPAEAASEASEPAEPKGNGTALLNTDVPPKEDESLPDNDDDTVMTKTEGEADAVKTKGEENQSNVDALPKRDEHKTGEDIGTGLLDDPSITRSRKPDTAVLSNKNYFRRAITVKLSNGTASVGENREIILVIRGMVERLMLKEDKRLILGRTDVKSRHMPDVDLTPYGALDRGVSRDHASLHLEGDRLYVTDLNSTNGTFLAGKRLDPHVSSVLRKGDELLLGRLPVQVLFR